MLTKQTENPKPNPKLNRKYNLNANPIINPKSEPNLNPIPKPNYMPLCYYKYITTLRLVSRNFTLDHCLTVIDCCISSSLVLTAFWQRVYTNKQQHILLSYPRELCIRVKSFNITVVVGDRDISRQFCFARAHRHAGRLRRR